MVTYLIYAEDKDGKPVKGSPFMQRGAESPAEAKRYTDIGVLLEMRRRAVNSGLPDPELKVTKVEVKEDESADMPMGHWKPKGAKAIDLNAFAKVEAAHEEEGDWIGLSDAQAPALRNYRNPLNPVPVAENRPTAKGHKIEVQDK